MWRPLLGGRLLCEFELPPGGLLDQKYDNKAVDQIYDLLPDEPEFPDDLCDLIEGGALKSDGSVESDPTKLQREMDDIH